MSSPIRSTQRAPRACAACYKAKVKCDKTIPCGRCVGRGIAQDCRREVVRVQGQIQGGIATSPKLSWDDLLHENHRLRAIITGLPSQEREAQPDTEIPLSNPFGAEGEDFETQLFTAVDHSSTPRTVSSTAAIVMPSRESSDKILVHAFEWTFWHHFSLLVPEFKAEHDKFWDSYSDKESLETVHPLWLAIYFSVLASELLFLSDDDLISFDLPNMEYASLLKNWYDSALYFLDRADFVQNLDIRSIQAISILGLVFPSVGDSQRHRALWSLAVRHAQDLKLGTDSAHQDEPYVEQQKRRRLWWTLVICEWLPVPHRSPCINDNDFECEIPDEIDDAEICDIANLGGKSRLPKSKPRPVQYHIAMIKLAKIYYQIRFRLRIRRWQAAEIAEFVFTADEQLALLISNLPSHLQFDEKQSEVSIGRDRRLPWIPWQRNSITKALLYYRMVIGRLLQAHWLDGSISGTRTRAICISSAQGLVNTTRGESVDPSKMRPWYVIGLLSFLHVSNIFLTQGRCSDYLCRCHHTHTRVVYQQHRLRHRSTARPGFSSTDRASQLHFNA